MEEPPAFQEASRCDVCKCSFNTFRRRHHCRCCGRTLCNEHSSNQMALPQFGINSNVRVCSNCFNGASRSDINESQTTSEGMDATTNMVSRLHISEEAIDVQAEPAKERSQVDLPECKCGMPLCICVTPASDPTPSQDVMQVHTTVTPRVHPTTKPKKAINIQATADSTVKNMNTAVNNKPSMFFSLGQAIDGDFDKHCAQYDCNGEGLREAIKNNDAQVVKKLLSEGVDPNYCDRQGMSLLHLAALFNHTEITFILMDHGASTERKNAQGETPVDCAPTMLQYKMRKKLEEGSSK
ncbi:hypothetical protein AMTRI_Chr12g266960 [Amborella trichopoda]